VRGGKTIDGEGAVMEELVAARRKLALSMESFKTTI
jgi:hypothetical protein